MWVGIYQATQCTNPGKTLIFRWKVIHFLTDGVSDKILVRDLVCDIYIYIYIYIYISIYVFRVRWLCSHVVCSRNGVDEWPENQSVGLTYVLCDAALNIRYCVLSGIFHAHDVSGGSVISVDRSSVIIVLTSLLTLQSVVVTICTACFEQ
jgi:hypothetical protein